MWTPLHVLVMDIYENNRNFDVYKLNPREICMDV